MEAFVEQGIIATILGLILLAIGWLGRRLLGKDGLAERVVSTHLDFVHYMKQAQTETNSRLCDHIANEDADRDALIRAGRHACEVATEVVQRLELSEAAREHIAAIKRELDTR